MSHASLRATVLCTIRAALRLVRAAPPALGALAAHGAVAQRVIDLTESVAGRGVRGLFVGLGRALVALGTDESDGAANHRQNGFLCCRRVLASYAGEFPVK
jgi:hypothetical protein